MVGDHDLRRHLRELAADLVDLGRASRPRRGSRAVCLEIVGRDRPRGRPRDARRRLWIDRMFAPGCPKAAHLRYPNGTTELGKRAVLPCHVDGAAPHPAARSSDQSGAPWSTEVLPGTLAIACVALGGLPVRGRRAFSSARIRNPGGAIPCHGVSSNSHAGDQRAPDQRPHPGPRGTPRRTRRRADRHQAAARGTVASPVSSTSTSSRLRRQANPPVCRVMDYGKYKYEEAQKAKESRRKSTQRLDQGDEVPTEDRQRRLRHQDPQGREVPRRGSQGQGHDHVPRPGDGTIPSSARRSSTRSPTQVAHIAKGRGRRRSSTAAT